MRSQLAARLAAGTLIVAALSACAGPNVIPSSTNTAGADVRLEVKKGDEGGIGSGVYIGNDIIITAAHVVAGADEFKIKSDAGDVQDGEVLWVNTKYDIAAIRPANGKRFKAAELACREPVVGEVISAAGNPGGVEFITMHGYVSGAERELSPKWGAAFITDMTTIGGMSGGPTYDSAGRVIGITVGTFGVGGPEGGMGFAVPSSVVCRLLGRASA